MSHYAYHIAIILSQNRWFYCNVLNIVVLSAILNFSDDVGSDNDLDDVLLCIFQENAVVPMNGVVSCESPVLDVTDTDDKYQYAVVPLEHMKVTEGRERERERERERKKEGNKERK